jgi:hypothetical protein
MDVKNPEFCVISDLKDYLGKGAVEKVRLKKPISLRTWDF